MKEDLLKIIKHYGEENQRNKLAEEYRELQDELYKFMNDEEEDILSEIADVLVVVLQFIALAGYNFEFLETVIKKEMQYKINRQLERINNENLNN